MAESVRKPAAAWGEAVEGVQCRVRAEKRTWPQGALPKLLADLRNQGQRNLRIAIEHESWELEIDGTWHRTDTAYSGDRWYLPLGPGQQQQNLEVWIRADDNIGRRLRALEPGEHTLRVARLISSIRVVSNPVEITIERALPGSRLSIDEVVKEEAAFAAVCEAVARFVPTTAMIAPGGAGTVSQEYKVVEVLFGNAERVDRIDLVYKLGRAIRKHERVIWIGHTRNMGFHGRLYGLKALPDTPENRQAVKAAAAKTRPSVAESVRKAAAWGEAAEGLRCRVRCDQAAWSPGERLILRVDTLNTGDREMELYVRPHWCKVEFDGKWYHKHFTRYRHASFVEKKKLGKGGRHDGLEIPLADSWLASRGHDPMQLSPGKHTVRVRVSARPTDGAGPLWVSPISNAIEIDILPAESGKEATWGEAVEGVQCRVRAEKRTWPKGTAPKLLADLREQGRSNEGELFNLPNDRVPGAFIFVTPAHVQHLLLACREHR